MGPETRPAFSLLVSSYSVSFKAACESTTLNVSSRDVCLICIDRYKWANAPILLALSVLQGLFGGHALLYGILHAYVAALVFHGFNVIQ